MPITSRGTDIISTESGSIILDISEKVIDLSDKINNLTDNKTKKRSKK